MMKTLHLTIVLFVIRSIGICQEAAVANVKQNIAYPGVSNPIRCIVSNYPADAVELSTNNGTIQKLGGGNFNYVPKEAGAPSIFVWVNTKSGKIKVDSMPFQIKRFPAPIASIVPRGVRAILDPDLNVDGSVRVESFEAIGLSGDSCLFRFTNTGPVWNDSNKVYLTELKPGNSILIKHILCKMPDGTIMEANQIPFSIN